MLSTLKSGIPHIFPTAVCVTFRDIFQVVLVLINRCRVALGENFLAKRTWLLMINHFHIAIFQVDYNSFLSIYSQ